MSNRRGQGQGAKLPTLNLNRQTIYPAFPFSLQACGKSSQQGSCVLLDMTKRIRMNAYLDDPV